MLTWREQSRDFIRSEDGRFDLFCNAAGEWTAVDWDRAGTLRCAALADAKSWCEGRANGTTSAKEAA